MHFNESCARALNLMGKGFSETLYLKLLYTKLWTIQVGEDGLLQQDVQEEYSDEGLVLSTMNKITPNQVSTNDGDLYNFAAELILANFLKKAKLFSEQTPNMIRVHWNYYNRSSYLPWHKDLDPDGNIEFENIDNCYSLVYNINGSDGGTTVGDEFYEGVEDSAIMFKANTLHRGHGPKMARNRFSLNILFEA